MTQSITPATDACGPVASAGVLCTTTPVIVSFPCTCGDEQHGWTSVAYTATATQAQADGTFQSDRPLATTR